MSRLLRGLLLGTLALLVGIPAFLSPVVAEGADPEAPDPPLGKPEYPRLDSQLNEMVAQLGLAPAPSIASAAPLCQGSSVAVTVRLAANVAAIVDFLELGGATVANVGADYIEAYVPVSLLVEL